MNFGKYDSRTKAENGARMVVKDPFSGEDVVDDKGDPCCVVVRGVASPTVQKQQRDKRRALLEKQKKKNEDTDAEARVLEDLHESLCDSAAPYIIEFVNIHHADGHSLDAANPDDIAWFLNLTFPEMQVKRDEDGDPIYRDVFDEVTGRNERVLDYDLVNKTFAAQIGEFAGKQSNFLGNEKSS